MQFFLNFVLWPFVGGVGFMYFGVMVSNASAWWFLGIWFVPWVTWPLGPRRRLLVDAQIKECKKELDLLGGLILTIGVVATMFLASTAGSSLTATYLERVRGIDIPARLEELQKQHGQESKIH